MRFKVRFESSPASEANTLTTRPQTNGLNWKSRLNSEEKKQLGSVSQLRMAQ